MKRVIPPFLAFSLLLAACNRTTSNFSNDHYIKRTPIIVEAKGKRHGPIVAYQVEEWHREKHEAAQTTLWKQDEFNIDTSDDGHLKMSSKTKQTEQQVKGSTAPFRHIVWAWMLSGTLNTLNEVLGKSFETWSNNETAVDLEKIETDGEIQGLDAMD